MSSKRISIFIDQELVDRLDVLAEELMVGRGWLIAKFCDDGLDRTVARLAKLTEDED